MPHSDAAVVAAAAAPRLLILSCSRRKRPGAGWLPAVERYDGPPYRVLRRFLAAAPQAVTRPEVLILSAEFGLIPAGHPLPDYDRRMTPERADALRPAVLERLRQAISSAPPGGPPRRPNSARRLCVFLSLGRDYLRALAGWESLLPPGAEVQLAAGPPGCRLRRLRDWLNGT